MTASAVTATAPGKLILLGEYAVLHGATALVAAVDRRARATVAATADASKDGEIHVLAADLGIDARGRRAADGAVRWDTDAATADRLRLVGTVIGAPAVTATNAPQQLAVTLSTTAFFDAPGAKLGLGSSAALAVALAGALAVLAGRQAPSLADLVRLHRAAQGGRGSGADIAAALTGGVVAYTADAESPTAESVRLPDDLRWCCVFTGRSTSTASFLDALATWRQGNKGDYRARLDDLTRTAAAGADAARRGDTDALLEAIGGYGAQLDRLGAASGIDIVGAEHRAIGNAAATCGVLYKPSGAGGGDIGLGFARDAGHIEAFRHAVMRLGYTTVDAAVDPQGLTISSE